MRSTSALLLRDTTELGVTFYASFGWDGGSPHHVILFLRGCQHIIIFLGEIHVVGCGGMG